MRKPVVDVGKIHNNESTPIMIEKIDKIMKEKKFDINKIFDHNYKEGDIVKEAKKEKKKVKESLAWSFLTREQGKIAPSYKKHLPYT